MANLPFLLIKEIKVEGAIIVKVGEIKSRAQSFLTGRYWGLFPKAHYWWYPADELKTELLAVFPRLADVSFTKQFNKELIIKVSEREPVLTYCPDDREGCFFVDMTGRVYAPAPRFSPGVFLEWRASTSPATWPFNLTSPEQITRLQQTEKIFNKVFELLTLKALRVHHFEATPEADFIFWVTASHPWQIIIDSETAAVTLGDNLHTALLSILKANGTTTLQKLEYVDLRFGKKVFYKL